MPGRGDPGRLRDAPLKPDHQDPGDSGPISQRKKKEDVSLGRLFFVLSGASSEDRAGGSQVPARGSGAEPDEAPASGSQQAGGVAAPEGIVSAGESSHPRAERSVRNQLPAAPAGVAEGY